MLVYVANLRKVACLEDVQRCEPRAREAHADITLARAMQPTRYRTVAIDNVMYRQILIYVFREDYLCYRPARKVHKEEEGYGNAVVSINGDEPTCCNFPYITVSTLLE